jgi:hypothetical protein
MTTTFEIRKHSEVDEGYQGFNLTEFLFTAEINLTTDLILDTFLRSTHFSFDSLRDVIKKDTKQGFLRQAFVIDEIHISDFRKLNKSGTRKFLIDFLNEPDWGEGRNEFAKLLDKYLEVHDQLSEETFYVINKDWFSKDSKKVLEPENWVYTFYFLIIYVDMNSQRLIVTEWTYD